MGATRSGTWRSSARCPGRGPVIPGHFDAVGDPADLYTAGTTAPIAGGRPVIEVDTAAHVDGAALADRVSGQWSRPVEFGKASPSSPARR